MSTLAFRNVDASPAEPVSGWPQEAIQAALERGGLSDWRLLAEAIQAQPWGPVTRRVEEVLGYSHPYGVAKAMGRVIGRAREEAEKSEREAVAAEIDALVRESGLSQGEFASRIGTSPSRLSTYVNGKVTPSASLLVRMRHAVPTRVPDLHDVKLAEILLELTPEERLQALRRYARLREAPRERR